MPVDAELREPFLGASALLLLTDLSPARSTVSAESASALLGLTLAEAKIAIAIGGGQSPAEAAQGLGISAETARTQLKRVYAKLGIERQSQLAMLISRIASVARR